MREPTKLRGYRRGRPDCRVCRGEGVAKRYVPEPTAMVQNYEWANCECVAPGEPVFVPSDQCACCGHGADEHAPEGGHSFCVVAGCTCVEFLPTGDRE